MGKNLIKQARGKGGPRYRAPSFNYLTNAKFVDFKEKINNGKIIDLSKCIGHSAPMMHVLFDNGQKSILIAPDGVRVGDLINVGPAEEIRPGSILQLKDLPEGTNIYNIELNPGDGGRFCRTSGTFAKILTKTNDFAIIELPSKKQRNFDLKCRAAVGIIAGSGRVEKPILKAGKKHHAMKARNKRYPIIGASSQNAVDHPFGNKRSARKAKQKGVGHFAPPGRKVGKLWPRRTGRKK